MTSTGTARALFDYEQQDGSCIGLIAGEMLVILEMDDGPWIKGRKQDGTEGWFPSSFVELLEPASSPLAPPSGDTGRRPSVHRPHSLQVRETDLRMMRMQSGSSSSSLRVDLTQPLTKSRSHSMDRPETIKVHEPITTGNEPALSWTQELCYSITKDSNEIGFMFMYIVANFIYFWVTFDEYSDRKSFDVLGHGLTIARGAGALLKLNCSFILLTMCRSLLTWLRGFDLIDKYIPLDSHIKIHKYTAYWIWVLAMAHSIAHVFNMNKLSLLNDRDFAEYFPTISPHHTSLGAWLLSTLPGLTGLGIFVAMLLMYASALQNVRHKGFEVFWYTHHLFIVFIFLLMVHGAAALFEAPGFWKWAVVPVVLYGGERLQRFLKSTRGVTVHHVSGESSDVLAVYMERPSHFLRYKAGQYLFLNCPTLSPYQWHPFTITSSPEEKYLSCHIKGVGSWTKGLHTLLNPQKKLGDVLINQSKTANGSSLLRVDGPYGAPSEHAFDCRVSVLIGAGIGVTPYAAMLKSMFYKLLLTQTAPKEYNLQLLRTEKVHFYWIARDRHAFEWFAYLLRDLEERAKGFLEVHTYITKKFKLEEIESYVQQANDDSVDPMTKLNSATHFGRPNFKQIFQDMCDLYPGEKVGVFFCGPKIMSNAISKACDENSSSAGTQFIYRKENF